MRKPTQRQLQVCRAIYDLSIELGTPPTWRDIAGRIGCASTNAVNDHVLALEKKGLVERAATLARSIWLTKYACDLLKVKYNARASRYLSEVGGGFVLEVPITEAQHNALTKLVDAGFGDDEHDVARQLLLSEIRREMRK